MEKDEAPSLRQRAIVGNKNFICIICSSSSLFAIDGYLMMSISISGVIINQSVLSSPLGGGEESCKRSSPRACLGGGAATNNDATYVTNRALQCVKYPTPSVNLYLRKVFTPNQSADKIYH